MQGENSEIDLVDVSFFLIRKWLSIVMTTLNFCCHWLCFCELATRYQGCEY